MAFLITTTGTQSVVTFNDLGARSFTHPTTNFDLETNFSIDEIRSSVDVFDSISLGYITATYNDEIVTVDTDIDEVRSNDNRLFVENEIIVKKNPGIGEFLTITDALSSITTNTITNRFRISVGPGTYIEDTITLKSYVFLVGSGSETTIIQVNGADKDVIHGVDNSYISDFLITGATDTGKVGIYYITTITATLHVENIKFGSNNILMKIVGSGGGNGFALCSNLNIGDGYYYETGFICTNDGSGLGRMLVKSTRAYSRPADTAPDIFALVDAPNCELILNAVHVKNAALGGVGLQVENGGILRVTGLNITGFDKAVYVPNIGTASLVRMLGANFEDNTFDVVIEHPGTSGMIGFPSNVEKIDIHDDSSVFIPNKDSRIITVAKRGGDFTSIASAVNFITDSGIDNRYVVSVGPGIYIEPLIDLSSKSYINIVGNSISSTVVKPDTDSHNIIELGQYCEISFMDIRDAGVGYAGIAYEDNGDFGQVHKLTFTDCDTCILINSSSVDTYFYGEYIDFNGAYSYGTKIEANNGFIAFANLENYYNLPTYATASFPYGTYVSGVGSEIHILAAGNLNLDGEGGTALYLLDGGIMNVSSTYIKNFRIGIHIPNIGSGPDFVGSGMELDISGLYDILIDNPSTNGSFQGSADMGKVIIDNNSIFNILIQDLTEGSLNISKALNIRFQNGTVADVSTLIIESSTMGLMEGGGLTDVGGLTVSISDGFGYLEQFPDSGFLKKVIWEDTSIGLSANTTNYIFWNYNGILSTDSSIPDTFYNILLGRVVTNTSTIEVIDPSALQAEHNGNRLSMFARHAIGPVYVSGSLVTENIIPFHIDVSQGHYHFAENIYHPVGGTGITFSSYYRDGSGGFIKTLTTLVDNENYDDGSGILQPLSIGYYAKHTLYGIGGVSEKYFLVYSQEEFSALALAEQGNIPLPPSYFDDALVLISSLIVKQGVTSSITEIQDLRPIIGFRAPTVTATTFHGNLLGLSNDDHPQYLLVTGTRAMTGNLDLGSNNIINVNLVDGVDVSTHASRHLPNGSDPLTTGTPSFVGLTSSTGVLNSLSRQDHIHALGTNIVNDNNILSHTSSKITIVSKSLLNTSIVYTDQSNTYGDFNQIFRSSRLLLSNPANTFNYTFIGSGITASRNLTIPALTTNDVIVTESFIQTLSNKSISGLSNTISNISLTSSVVGILSPSNGGSGVNNGINTITLGGNLVTSGTFSTTFTQLFTGTITLPGSTSSLATLSLTENLTNKTLDNTNTISLKDTLFTLQDDVDNTKQLQFQLSGITSSTTRTLTAPDVSAVITVRDSVFRSTLTTTNSTATTIISIPTSSNTAYLYEVRANCVRVTGTGGGVNGDSNAYIRTFKVKNVGGTLTIGSIQSSFTDEDIAAHNITFITSGTNILIQVAGSTSNTVDWVVLTEIITVS